MPVKKLTKEQYLKLRKKLFIRKLIREKPPYREYYESPIAGRVLCMSPYESQFVRFLDELGIKWKQAKESFKYRTALSRKTVYKRWIPDYVVLDEIGLPSFFIEIKGTIRVEDIAQWEDFPDSEKLIVISDKELKQLGLDVREGYRRYRAGKDKTGWKKTGDVSEELKLKIDPQPFLDLVEYQMTCTGHRDSDKCSHCFFQNDKDKCRARIEKRDYVEPRDNR